MTVSGQIDPGGQSQTDTDETGVSSPKRTSFLFHTGIAVTFVFIALSFVFFPVRPYLSAPTGRPEPTVITPTVRIFPTSTPEPFVPTKAPTPTPGVEPADFGCSADGSGTEGCQKIGNATLRLAGCPTFTNYYCDHLCYSHREFGYPRCKEKMK